LEGVILGRDQRERDRFIKVLEDWKDNKLSAR
jgi:hypothetical protein